MLEGNELLEILPEPDQAILNKYVTEIPLHKDQILFHPGDLVRNCYFPKGSAVISYFVVFEDGSAVETMVVGSDGAAGNIVSDCHARALARGCIMQPGSCYRITSADLLRAQEAAPRIADLLMRYMQCQSAQMLQSIACNASHSIEQRAAKWLCAAVDRSHSSGISMTQEELAALMGSGRSYASRVVQRFKRDALLLTRRGGIEVLDYKRLLERACACNTQVREHCNGMLSGFDAR